MPGTPVTALHQGVPVEYRLLVPSPASAVITMDSGEIDSVLVLEGEGVRLEDDDSGNALNARISTVLAPGEYTLHAGSYGRNGGVFTLSASLSEGPGREGDGGLDTP